MRNNNVMVNIGEFRVKRSANERRERNRVFAVQLLSRWSSGGPASGYSLFNAIVSKAVHGPIATPERAAILLPVLLEVLDEMEGEAEPHATFQQPQPA